MTILAREYFTRTRDSYEAGEEAARHLLEGLPAPRVVLVYQTASHRHDELLAALTQKLGPEVSVVGCSAQGVIGRGDVREDGYAASFMALGGETLRCSTALVNTIHENPREKGAKLGRELRAGLNEQPTVAILHFDPMSGVDIGQFLEGMYSELECPIVGAASGHHFSGTSDMTYLFHQRTSVPQAAVSVALAGEFQVNTRFSSGCSPIGADMKVTRSDGTMILELDGRPALEVWKEISGSGVPREILATVAIGLPSKENGQKLIRAAYLFDEQRQGIVLQTAVPEGTQISLYHRTIAGLLDGSAEMATKLAQDISDKTARAILCFECGARTQPFLGNEETRNENLALQAKVGLEPQWAGLCCWGEIFSDGGAPSYHNYSYAILALSD